MAISHLGYEIDSSQAKRAAVDLDAMTKSAERAEKGERDLARASQQAETATGQLARASKGATTATAQLETSLDGASAASQRMAASAQTATGAMRALQAANMNVGMAAQRNQQLMYQWVDIGQALATAPMMGIYALQNLGFQMAQIGQMYYGQGGMRAALSESASLLGGFARAVGPAAVAVGAVSLAILGMQQEINAAGGTVVSFGDVAMATFQVVRDGVMTTLQPAFSALGSAVSFVWEHIKNGVPPVVNLIINSFRAAFEDIKFVWANLPNIIGAAAVGAGNAVIRAINGMVNGALEGMNKLIRAVNSVASFLGAEKAAEWLGLGGDGQIDEFAPWKGFALDDNKFARRLASAAGDRNARIAEIMSSDPLGAFFDQVSVRATENALRGVEDAAGDAGGAIGRAANDNKDPWEGLREVTKETNGAMEQTERIAQSIGSTIANTLRQGGSLWEGFKEAGLDAIAKVGEAWLTSGIQDMIGGFGSGGDGIFGSLFSWLGFSRGAAFQSGNVVPFATGGVVSGPTTFPMSGGRTGLMGEAGPEAIMPLKRGRDGRLGVAAVSNQNQAPNVARIEQHFHISGAVSSDDVQRMVRRGAEESVTVVKENLRGWQTDIQLYGKPA